ncbi:hypothetical protein ZWY2020_048863 [Hordeum vulgare]|nr:hypothetical protein ZWY2020_048863 [Hordeum vulgare]
MPDLLCDGDVVCMVCHAAAPPEVELLRCVMPWHSPCLSKPPALTDAAGWACPNCRGHGASHSSAMAPAPRAAPGGAGGGSGLLAAIREIEADATLSEQDKAWRHQELLDGKSAAAGGGDYDDDDEEQDEDNEDNTLEIGGKNFSCVFCMKLRERLVTSVALSGGYIDDEDHGEWFLYTGSEGRDLSGNKRTNKEQSSDQKFDKMNSALRLSCQKGYPVRVVRLILKRSHKEKRSSYALESGVLYDGVYRIEKCWRKIGVQDPRLP